VSASAIAPSGPSPARTSLRARPGAVPLGAILAGCALVAITMVALLPLDRLPFSLCVFKATTGIPCMTCGTTRALARLARFDLAGALAMNPLTTLGTLALGPWAAADLLLLLRGRALSLELSPAAARVARIAAVAAVLTNWAWLIAAGR
jgi:Protein of unknown function (DUF2752)